MRHPHWTSDHRDALLTRVTVITAVVAGASAVGAVGLGAGLQAGTSYAAATKAAPATGSEPSAPAETVAPEPSAPEAFEPSSEPSTPSVAAQPLSPDQIHLVIYNATTTRGVASAAAKILRNEGFQVDSVATNPGGAARTSAILYSSDVAGGVGAVTKATGIQRTATSSTGGTVVLVLGRDWVAATAGTAWAPPKAAPAQPQRPSNGGGGTTTSGGS